MAQDENQDDGTVPLTDMESGAPADGVEDSPAPGTATRARRRIWRRALMAVLLVGVASAGAAWMLRKRIAENVISSELSKLGLPAQYTVQSIGPSEQVITNLVIGDPAHPDLTVKKIQVATRLWWGLPAIGRITLVEPRLYGTVHAGKPSFGALDKVLFTGGKQPFRMPDLDIAIIDGRALMDADWGRVGLKLDGSGPLRGGFQGELAAVTPGLVADGCKAGKTSFYGKVSVQSEKPRLTGPLRLASLACPERGLTLGATAAQSDFTFDSALNGGQVDLGLQAGNVTFGANHAASLSGPLRVSYRNTILTARYDLTARSVQTAQVRLASLRVNGQGRTSANLSRFDGEGDVSGQQVRPGPALETTLDHLQQAGEGNLLAPLTAKIRTALMRETRGSHFDANMVFRKTDQGFSLVMPKATLRATSGKSLLALSRAQILLGQGPLRAKGDFITGGIGLPQVYGRMEMKANGSLAMQVSMAEYQAGESMIALPRMTLNQDRQGTWKFGGAARLSGPLPGGDARDLVVPLEGTVFANGDLDMWRQCTQVGFNALSFANLTLDKRAIQVCPVPGKAIVRRRGDVWQVAAGLGALDLSGHLGETPIRINSGAVGLAWPGIITARNVQVALGPQSTASRFHLTNLEAHIGKDIGGRFDGADILLAAVPLDLHDTSGQWSYSNGTLSLKDAAFRLEDRAQVDRFQPLVAQGASLQLANNRIIAHAQLREPESHSVVTDVDIVHDLATASGHATLAIPKLVFGKALQATQLSSLALGVVSDLKGTVTGKATIDWNSKRINSTGQFSSDGLAFAAAFGPVSGLSGTVHFTDLLDMVTAPNQTVHVASINPGIEVENGTLSYQMEPGHLMRVNGAKWPFMDGTLELLPTTMRLGVSETRHYTLKVTGLNAATFVQHLNAGNIAATGIFDGQVPLVFDENGGRIEDGELHSRPPGGHVAYLGALSYKDLSTMGNFAFSALRSVDYKSMDIGLGGSLSGELLTRIRFDGLSQGQGASKNFLTRRIAKLPIRFIVNIKAPFFSLFGSLRSLYDPSYVTDPRTLGLLGTSAPVVVIGGAPAQPTAPTISGESHDGTPSSVDIQHSVSEKRP